MTEGSSATAARALARQFVAFGLRFAQPLGERRRQPHLRDRFREPLDLALHALLVCVVGIGPGAIPRELVRTLQRFLLDPGRHVRRGQRATHMLKHDAIDLGI
jgi:hypothetical protein